MLNQPTPIHESDKAACPRGNIMGKAIITENLQEGKYKIEYRYNATAIEARLEKIDVEIAAGEQTRVETQVKLDAALIHMRTLNDLLNGVLSSTTLTAAEKEKQSREIVTQQQAHRLVIVGLQGTLAAVAATRTSLQLEYLRLDKVPRTRNRTVWSADYSPDLGIATNGDWNQIGTIEVPGEEQEVLLYPAKNLFRAWTPAIDGDMTPVAAQSPMAWFYNTCVVTGWQKYRPTYRFAKVLEILTATRMKVELIPPLKSTYGDVDITPTLADLTLPSYAEVECDYLDCHTQAFSIGDEVVVQYMAQNADQPKVIGFRHNPKPCSQITFYTPWDALRVRGGTEAEWTNTKQQGQRYGNAYWVGDGGACSWQGWKTRYRPHVEDGDYTRFIYTKGREYEAPGIVLGGCLVKEQILAVCQIAEGEAYYHVLFRTPHANVGTAWQQVGRTQMLSADYQPWHFSQSGLRAATVQYTTVGDDPPVSATQVVSLTYTVDGTVSFATASPVLSTQVVTPDVGTVTTTFQVALDYVGETLVTLDTIDDMRTVPFTDYSAFGVETTVVTKLRCSAVGLTLTTLQRTSRYTGFFVGIGTAIREIMLIDIATPDGLEHLNVTGGAGRTIAVLRKITLASNFESVFTETESSGADIITLTQELRIQVGLSIVPVETRGEAATFSASTGSGVSQTDNYDAVSALKSGNLTNISTSACDRLQHILTSSPWATRTTGHPRLPTTVNANAASPVGLG